MVNDEVEQELRDLVKFENLEVKVEDLRAALVLLDRERKENVYFRETLKKVRHGHVSPRTIARHALEAYPSH